MSNSSEKSFTPISTSDQSPEYEYAEGPFGKSARGDIILTSSDGLAFKVSSVILSYASDFFQGMFELPSEDRSSSATLQEVVLEEDEITILNLLHLIYPGAKPPLDSFDEVFDLLEACDKYVIDTSGMAPFFATLVWPQGPLDDETAADRYALAWRFRMKGCALEASRFLVDVDLGNDEFRKTMISHAGNDVRAYSALWALQLQREKSLESFKDDLPLSRYRCKRHRHLSIAENARLTAAIREAMSDPHPSCRNVIGFYDLFETFQIPDVGESVSGFCVECVELLQGSDGEDGISNVLTRLEKFSHYSVQWPFDPKEA